MSWNTLGLNVVSQAWHTESNTIIQVGAHLILSSVQLSYLGHKVVCSIFLMKSSHANLKVFRPNIAVENYKSISSCCRRPVGGWDLWVECVKWGLCLFMCARVSHLLLPFNRIRTWTGRQLLVRPPPVELILALPRCMATLEPRAEIQSWAQHSESHGLSRKQYSQVVHVGSERRGRMLVR